VLPVQRNPVTTTLAYNDNTKQRLNDNNNVSTADFASRVNPLAYLYTCAFQSASRARSAKMQLCSVVCMSVCLSGRLCVCWTQPCAVLKRLIEMHRFLMKLFSTSNTEIITYFAGTV